ncbi:MAG: DEAD/DEAH box helicase [Dehalococcoidales bacterium]|nr:DEAD/DEAH box helicase [Dehalococcoidales bacterium]
MNFEKFGFHASIMAGIRAQGYTTPTPVQDKAIPPVMKGRDVIGIAQTGTGKTAAFALPILNRLVSSPRGQVGALVISPTRELAEQTCEAINDLGYEAGIRAISIYGGVSMEVQTSALRRGAEIVAACPGRLLDHLMKGTIDLSRVEVLVIDEADRMFDMGFLPDIRHIVKCLIQSHQTLLFSATMPGDVRRLVSEVLHRPLTVQIGESAPVESVAHALYPVQPHLKIALLKEILRTTETDSVVVFVRTRHRVEQVTRQLARAGFSVASLQGDMAQYRRQEALDGFRDGSLKILVATDIASRGLDILSISHVINFDMPDTTDAYTHRIGRTGRVNRTGEAFTLVTSEDNQMVKALERIFKKPLEQRNLADFDYEAGSPVTDVSKRRRYAGRKAEGMKSQKKTGSGNYRRNRQKVHAC